MGQHTKIGGIKGLEKLREMSAQMAGYDSAEDQAHAQAEEQAKADAAATKAAKKAASTLKGLRTKRTKEIGKDPLKFNLLAREHGFTDARGTAGFLARYVDGGIEAAKIAPPGSAALSRPVVVPPLSSLSKLTTNYSAPTVHGTRAPKPVQYFRNGQLLDEAGMKKWEFEDSFTAPEFRQEWREAKGYPAQAPWDKAAQKIG